MGMHKYPEFEVGTMGGCKRLSSYLHAGQNRLTFLPGAHPSEVHGPFSPDVIGLIFLKGLRHKGADTEA